MFCDILKPVKMYLYQKKKKKSKIVHSAMYGLIKLYCAQFAFVFTPRQDQAVNIYILKLGETIKIFMTNQGDLLNYM